jgi:hypothetical protein
MKTDHGESVVANISGQKASTPSGLDADHFSDNLPSPAGAGLSERYSIFLPLTARAPASSPPVITSFDATPDTINLGEGATLSWSVTNRFQRLILEPGIGDVTAQTSVVVSPTHTTTYILTAYNSAGSDTAQVGVTLRPPPVITSFEADPDIINLGEDVTLRWFVLNTIDRLVIEPGIGDITGKTSVTVSPTDTVTYTITATNGSGSSRAQAMVTVRQPPVITEFRAAPDTINLGESATLSWDIVNPVGSLFRSRSWSYSRQ